MVYLFDFDGTLVDSMPAWIRKMTGALTEHGVTPPENLIEIITPLGDRGAAEYIRSLGVAMTVEDMLAWMDRQAYDDYAYHIPAKFGVPETLRALKAAGHSLNVLTASPHRMLDVCLKRLGLFDLFDHVWSCDDFPVTKADPAIYRLAAERLGTTAEAITFLDDNVHADTAAKAAGCRVIGVYDASSAKAEDAIRAVCDGYIYDFYELIPTQVSTRLYALRDRAYKAFGEKLLPTVDPASVIGVRVPAIRKLARELRKEGLADAFLAALPHRYYEENVLHTALLCLEKDFDTALAGVETFLPYIDNWGVCDGLMPAAFRKSPERVLPAVRRWITSTHPYTVRFAVLVLMDLFLDDRFDPAYPALVAAIESEDYYVNMMRAWYFATALAKQYDAVLPYLEERKLDAWTHKKAIGKAAESYRVPPERKAYLKTLR